MKTMSRRQVWALNNGRREHEELFYSFSCCCLSRDERGYAADPGVFIPGIVGGISMNTLVIARGVLIAHGHVRLDRLADFLASPISRDSSSSSGTPDQ